MIVTVKSINQLIFVMVKCGVLFEVGTEFLINNIYTSSSSKGETYSWCRVILQKVIVAHLVKYKHILLRSILM
jgi:hypothetical protein